MKKIIMFIIFILTLTVFEAAGLPFLLQKAAENPNQRALISNSLYSPFIQTDSGWQTDVILRGNFALSDLPASSERIHRYGRLTTLRLPLSSLQQLTQIEGIEKIYPSLKTQPLLDISTSDHMNNSYFAGCDADYIQENLGSGEGVIIGIIDPYQLNWQHEDFSDAEGSRILSIWDQQGSGNAPLLFDYGTEYTQDELNADNGPAINGGQSHGTQCAGIAAGNGNASGGTRAGMLPQAEIIYVRQESGSANIINAISYIAFKASELDATKPVVISLSVGAMFSDPDGSDPVALALTSFGSSGRCSAVAAGNWYNYDCFATGSALYEEPLTDLSFTISGSNTGNTDFVISRFYYTSGDDFAVTMTAPGSVSYGPVNIGEDASFNTPYGKLYVYHEETILGNPYIEVVVSDEYGTISAGDSWTIELNVPDEQYDDEGGWWWGWIAGAGYNAEFNNYYQGAYSLNTFACGAETVCTAAHDKSSGSIYASCSKGAPDAVVKPEITAPTNAYTPNAGSSTGYSSLCCTSGAAPHAAGAMGLMLQRNPTLTPAELITILTENAFTDGQTGTQPNDRWGYGKLNAKGSLLSLGYGDVDNTYIVDAFDASLVLMYAAGINYFALEDPLPWAEWRYLWADVDQNGEIEAYDASLILQYIVEIIPVLPVE